MNRIIVNQHSVDKDCSKLLGLINFVAVDKRIIWPVTMAGRMVEEVEGEHSNGKNRRL